ncbi:MAG: hypothetical protein QOD49_313 [Actinomycetota bacterium]|nr:hypothetical protein [Actinomycetota bacterium]
MKRAFKVSPRLLGGVGVALVVLVAGGFFAIKAIEGSSPPPLTAPVATTSPTVSPAAAGTSSPTPTVLPAAAAISSPSPTPPPSYDGTWHVGTGSVAGYRVRETLFGASNIAVGRTSTITGSLTVAGKLTAGSFSVDVASVKSDRSARDDSFKVRIMEVGTYPAATFNLTQPVDVGRLASASGHQVVNVTGNLELHGVTKPVTFPVSVTRVGTTVNVTGSIPVTFADYGIANPSNPIAQTESSGTLEFSLNFVRR